jgi:futalosine hydrolase
LSLSAVIASTETEAGLIIGRLSQKESSEIQGKKFYRGFLKDKEISVCICGIGKANAAHGTALLIERFKPDSIYIVGVAGAYPSSGLNIGDIAIAEKEIYGDEGLFLKNGFHPMNEILDIQNEFTMRIPEKFKDIKNRGNFITVSTCTGALEKGREIEKRLNALCENMEGAAIAQICALSGIPAVEMRGISNIIEDRAGEPLNKSDIVKAAENVQRFFLKNCKLS